MIRPGLRKMLLFWVLMIMSVWVFMGCSRDEAPIAAPDEGTYLIYYLNSAITKLVPRSYEAVSTNQEDLVAELMDQFIHVPKDLDCQPGLTDKVTFQGSRQEEQVLYLYFDVNYTAMKPEREILCRAALTRMMTQIKGVDYISIYCGDQPLMDRQGNPVGVLTSGDFIMNTSNVNAYEKTELTLYFADETGTSLVEEKREVVHNINTSLEQLESSLNQAMTSIRTSVHDLYDEALNLKEAVEKLVSSFSFCSVSLEYDMGSRLPPSIRYCFLSILKEALSNVIRHSDATSVDILMREHEDIYQLIIQDNGSPSPFSPPSDRQTSGGMGLSSMKERVQNLHGSIRFTCDNGFRIFVLIPKTQTGESHR